MYVENESFAKNIFYEILCFQKLKSIQKKKRNKFIEIRKINEIQLKMNRYGKYDDDRKRNKTRFVTWFSHPFISIRRLTQTLYLINIYLNL